MAHTAARIDAARAAAEAVEVRFGPKQRPQRWRPRRHWGRLVARILCGLFALVGVVPLGAGLLVRLAGVQRWVAGETEKIIQKQTGVDADFSLDIQPWPLEVVLENVAVHASDGGPDFLRARRIVARPRLFSLLSGKLDFGEVEIDAPEVYVALRGGELANLKLELPPSEPSAEPSEPPLSAVAVTDGRVELDLDGMRVGARGLDADVTIERGAIELGLRAMGAEIDRTHPDPARPEVDMTDEDAVCRLELRARLEPPGAGRARAAGAWGLLVRRLELEGAADFDPARGTRPRCDLPESDWRRVLVRLEAVGAELDPKGLASIDGRVKVFAPAGLLHRFVAFDPVAGLVALDLDAHHDRTDGSEPTLPSLSGTFSALGLGIGGTNIADAVSGRIDTLGNVVHVTDLHIAWGGGRGTVERAVIRPFGNGIPLEATGIVADGVTFADLLDEFGGHPHSHVGWTFEHATMARMVGQFDPFVLTGVITASTSRFAVYDRPADAPSGQRAIFNAPPSRITATMRVEPRAFILSQATVLTARSRVRSDVSLGFAEELSFNVFDGSFVDLEEVSPLADIPMKGRALVHLRGSNTFMSPVIRGDVSIEHFDFAGYPIGELGKTQVSFVPPLRLELRQGQVRHGPSSFYLSDLDLDFAAGPAVVLQAHVDSRTAEGLHATDLFNMTRFDVEPSLREIRGVMRGTASVAFQLGGPRDRCGAGVLHVGTQMDLAAVRLFGERFEAGSLDAELTWDDLPADERGLRVELYSAVLRTGPGTLVARGRLGHGARIEADVIGSSIPLERISAFASLFGEDASPVVRGGHLAGPAAHPVGADPPGASRPDAAAAAAPRPASARVRPEASASFVASVGGTLERLRAEVGLELSPTRIGPSVLPASQLRLTLAPPPEPLPERPVTLCGNARGGARTPAVASSGSTYHLSGQLFGTQVALDGLEVSGATRALLSGRLTLRDLDLGALANLLPGVAFSSAPPTGKLSADIEILELPLDEPALAEVQIKLRGASLERGASSIRIPEVSDLLLLSGDALRVPDVDLVAETAGTGGGKLRAALRAHGTVRKLSGARELDLGIDLKDTDVGALGLDMAALERASGRVSGSLRLTGTFAEPSLSGSADLRQGELRLRGVPLALDDVHAHLEVRPGEMTLRAATSAGAGSVALAATVPMRGFVPQGVEGTLAAQGLRLELADGIRMTADATLRASYDARSSDPAHVYGDVTLTSFAYTRPISLALDLDSLTTAGKTEVESYDPKADVVTFELDVKSAEPLRVNNNLLELELCGADAGAAPGRGRDPFARGQACGPSHLTVVGSNQRFGARGALRVRRGSKLYLQGHDFAVTEGTVRFDDDTRISPELDINASTEFQRYASSSTPGSSTAASGSASSGGRWRIDMHAVGDADALRVTFASDPPLSQDDVVLLLQIGMTRAELDRGLAGSLAQTVGLEALSAVTGADKAVRSIVPIDEFRFGSAYSSRTGRPEPTVTIGKRISESVRATVTTGLTENREIRSNLEWKLSDEVSVQGSYDNVNDTSSSTFGNLGLDLRLHLEFE
ncbi:MAG: translocation/assembly module TamB domain-containing protein [Polyangiaceae bacterium]|nr:translocation/assembly module TamB domain-containing protein [Polyangiaceae bacterium]